MNIKKLVVGSMFSMLLASEMAAADWGDVYYCQMTSQITISLDGELTRYQLETFKFKLDESRNAMVFESNGAFKGLVSEVDKLLSWPDLESWYSHAQMGYVTIFFEKGKLMVSGLSPAATMAVSADCEKL